MSSTGRRLGAEFLGTLVLVAAVVGSGIMAASLSDDLGVVLLINAISTVAALAILIWLLAPVSGAHFNPAVTAVAMARRGLPWRLGILYVAVQVVGACCGAILANAMFERPAVELSTQARSGWGLWLGEVVATAGLLFIVGALTATRKGAYAALLIPLWIGSAYFFASSTSFANPAVTVGRALTDTFTGIAATSVPAFILFQLIGAVLGAVLAGVLFTGSTPTDGRP